MEFVAILEDDLRRISAMKICLADILTGIEVIFFEDAQEMIEWLSEHLGEVALISLDHDLPLRHKAGKTLDCGTGRQVADHLALNPPTCPIIVHSSNSNCAQGMCGALESADWPCSRVYPSDDTAWIATSWAEQVRQHVRDGWIGAPKAKHDRGLSVGVRSKIVNDKATADENVIRRMDDALVCWGDSFRLLCGRCWTEMVIPKKKPMNRARAVRRFYERGWRCADVSLCPKCAGKTKSE